MAKAQRFVVTAGVALQKEAAAAEIGFSLHLAFQRYLRVMTWDIGPTLPSAASTLIISRRAFGFGRFDSHVEGDTATGSIDEVIAI